MKGLPLFVFLCISSMSFGQLHPDSSWQKTGREKVLLTIDSTGQNVVHLPDTLGPLLHKVDSLRKNFQAEADSIKTRYQHTISEVNEQTNRLNNSIDSLGRLNLPAAKYRHQLDSLTHDLQRIHAKFTSDFNTLKDKTTGKLNSLNIPPEYRAPLEELTQKINGLNLNSDIINMPELKIPGYSIPKMDGLGSLISEADVPGIEKLNNLPDMNTPLGEVGNITQGVQGYQDQIGNIVPGDLNQVNGQIQTYQEEIKDLAQGNAADVQKIPEAIESHASKIDGMEELQKQSGVIEGQKAQIDRLADRKSAEETAAEIAKQAAVDHFEGKEEQLKSAMDKISKYKQKYPSVSSIKDLPKRPPNPMRSKPFIERLVPGLYLQYQQKNLYLMDVNPYLGYKISGRFTSGLGWNHRFAYDKKYHSWNERSRIFGPRGYIDFKLGRGFIAHVEGESMNTFIPSTLFGNPDTGHREWVWSCMTGIKKEYRIYKNLKGTALIQYNLFNRYYKAPYVDRLNSRIGFEYTLKKNRKSPQQKK